MITKLIKVLGMNLGARQLQKMHIIQKMTPKYIMTLFQIIITFQNFFQLISDSFHIFFYGQKYCTET